MQVTTRANQGGSVAIFLIVSAILALAVIGGMYALQKRDTQTQIAGSTGADTSQQAGEQSDSTAKDSAAQKAAQAQEEQKKQAQQKQAADKKAQEEKAAADKKAADEAARQQAAIPQTSTAPAVSSDKLPQTGPSDTLWQVVGGAILLGVTLAYLKSYQYRFGSLL
ncbi:MAG: LPXTG cell wall anchor domain-containing protein [Candidatus Saccharimonadales bacterium]